MITRPFEKHSCNLGSRHRFLGLSWPAAADCWNAAKADGAAEAGGSDRATPSRGVAACNVLAGSSEQQTAPPHSEVEQETAAAAVASSSQQPQQQQQLRQGRPSLPSPSISHQRQQERQQERQLRQWCAWRQKS